MEAGEHNTAIRTPPTLSPASLTGAVEGSVIDTAGWEEALVIVHAGAIAATGTLDFKVQECETSDGSFTDIPDAAFAQFDNAAENTGAAGVIRLGAVAGRMRYIMVVATQATDTAVGCAHVILAKPNFTIAVTEAGSPSVEPGEGEVTSPDPPDFVIQE